MSDVHRRTCPQCGKSYPRTRRYFAATKDNRPRVAPRPVGRPMFRWGYCHKCNRARKREAYRRMREDAARTEAWRAQRRETSRRYRERHPDRVAETRARYLAAVMADPEKRHAYNVRQRIEHRLRRERDAGTLELAKPGVAEFDGYAPAGNGHWGPMLKADPLREWLAYEFQGWDTASIGLRCGVDEATVRRLLTGQYKRVSLHVADRMFVNADCAHLLAVLYPDDGTVAAA